MLTTADLAKVICCEGAECMKPNSCDAGREFRVPISPHRAAEAVRVALCREWANHRPAGPMSVVRRVGGRE